MAHAGMLCGDEAGCNVQSVFVVGVDRLE